jgi:ABC-2 type transport system permease protein
LSFTGGQLTCYIIGLTTIQCSLLFIGALLLGVRPAGGIPGILVILVINALFCAGVTTVSMILAFVVPSHPQFFSIVGFATLPILFLSSALVPLNRMPDWLRILSSLNPMTHAIEATRSLVITGWDFRTLGTMFDLLIAFDVLILLVAARIFSSRLGRR